MVNPVTLTGARIIWRCGGGGQSSGRVSEFQDRASGNGKTHLKGGWHHSGSHDTLDNATTGALPHLPFLASPSRPSLVLRETL